MHSSDLGIEFKKPALLPFKVAEKRFTDRPFMNFQVFGERNSGTNFVSELIGTNTEMDAVRSYGWKHGFQVAVAFHPRSLIIFVYRDPIDWLVSMYNRPYAAKDCVDFTSFSTFLRSEWATFLRANAQKKWTERWNATIVEGVDGRECAVDRHPLTGKRFKNPLEMRRLKLFGGLSMVNQNCNFIAAPYEMVSKHREEFVQYVRDFAKVGGGKIDPINQKVSPSRATKRYFKRNEILHEDFRFIREHLDLELEGMIGYDPETFQ